LRLRLKKEQHAHTRGHILRSQTLPRKTRTIPIAKRRYYGRVQQAVHEFLLLGPSVVKGEALRREGAGGGGSGSDEGTVQLFFDPNGVVVVPAKRSDISGQCTKKDGDCRGREVRDSRYNDMKASMYLLANAFRTDQQKPPDRLPTVKAAKAFFREMNELEKIVKSRRQDAAAQEDAAARYAAALHILDEYLDLVELPPTDSGHYDKDFDTLVGETARIT
jgi:hypothetical protein